MIRNYIDVNGVIHRYEYSNKNIQKNPKCSKCNNVLNYIFYRNNGKHINIGYICKDCNIVYISDKYISLKFKNGNKNE